MKYKGYDLPNIVSKCYKLDEKADFLIDKLANGVSFETVRIYATMFAAIGEYEKQFKSNILDMSPHKMAVVFEMYVSSYSNYLRLSNVLKQYFEFHGKDFGSLNITFDDLNVSGNFESQYIKDMAMLDDLIQSAFPFDNTSLNIFAALAIYLTYLGFRKKDIALIRKTDVDLQAHAISYNGQVVSNIPVHIVDLCRQCMELEEIYPATDNCFGDSNFVNYKICDNDYLLRTLQSIRRNDAATCSNSSLNRYLAKFNEANYGKYSYDTIRYSGLYEWLYVEEQAGRFSVDMTHEKCEKIFSDHLQYHCSPAVCLKNYMIWRELFYGY